MRYRAPSSGITLNENDAAIIKGMLQRGDRQHDIAAWFGVNGGRIAEIATGAKFGWVQSEPLGQLPPQGPYPGGREATAAVEALEAAKKALADAEEIVRAFSKGSTA